MTMGIQQLMWKIEGIRDAFHTAVFTDHDVAAALFAAGPDCALANLPVGTGARGDELGPYLAEQVLPHLPDDLTFRRLTRTVDQRRVVEETTVAFTHDRELPWLLPGVAPTHRYAQVLAISVVSFTHTTHLSEVASRITSHRTLWDQHALLADLRLAPEEVRVHARVSA